MPRAPLAVPCGPQSTTKATTLEDYACATQWVLTLEVSLGSKYIGPLRNLQSEHPLIVVSGEVKLSG